MVLDRLRKRLKAKEVEEPETTSIADDTPLCPKCSNPLPTKAFFCAICGTRLGLGPLGQGAAVGFTGGPLQAQTIIPSAANAYNLGSSSLYWLALYINTITAEGSSPALNGFSLGTSTAGTGILGTNNIWTATQTTQTILPSADNTYNLGSSSYRWATIYAGTDIQVLGSSVITNQTTLQNSLVGYWSLDEGTGTTAYDLSGNGYIGTLIDAVTWVTGKFGYAVHINTGSNSQYVSVNDTPNMEWTGQAYSFGCWFYPTNAWTSYVGYPMSKAWNGNGRYNYQIGWGGSQIVVYLMSGETFQYSAPAINVSPLNTWHHIFVTLTAGSNATICIYLDGTQVVSQGTNISSWTPSGGGNTNLPLALGTLYPYAAGHPDSNNYNFPGYLDEVRFYNRTLSPSEVRDLFISYPLDPYPEYSDVYTSNTSGLGYGLVGYYPFDEYAGSTVYDLSGNGISGTLGGTNSALPTWTNGIFAFALNFNSTNATYVDFGASRWQSTTAFTISAWVYPTYTTGSNSTLYTILGLSFDYTNSKGVWLFTDGVNSSALAFEIGNGSAVTLYEATAAYVGTNQWNHVVFTYTNAGTSYLYINGVQVGSYASSPAIVYGATNAQCGKRPDSTYGWQGKIDDLRIYNRALTTLEVRRLYTSFPVFPVLTETQFFRNSNNNWYGTETFTNAVSVTNTTFTLTNSIFAFSSGTNAIIQAASATTNALKFGDAAGNIYLALDTGTTTTGLTFWTFQIPNQTYASASTDTVNVIGINSFTVTLQGNTTVNSMLGMAMQLNAPTINVNGTNTITVNVASTLSILGAPTAGTNVTITNAYSLYISGGTSYFNGSIVFGSNTYTIGSSTNFVATLYANTITGEGTTPVINGFGLGTSTAGTGILGTAQGWTAVQTFGNNISFGGFVLNVSSGAKGDTLYNSGSNWANLAIGTTNQVLTVVGGVPSWAAVQYDVQTNVFTNTGTNAYTYTTPTNAKSLYVICIGAGGGGGGARAGSNTSAGGGAGGGGAGLASTIIVATSLASNYAVTVGAGGGGGAGGSGSQGATGAVGTNGGTTNFGAVCYAQGGVGGTNTSSNVSGAGGSAGLGNGIGGSGAATASSNTNGTNATNNGWGSGGGSGGGGGSAAGTNTLAGGSGASTISYSGGAGGAGKAATSLVWGGSGGGGGGASQYGTGGAGGTGSNTNNVAGTSGSNGSGYGAGGGGGGAGAATNATTTYSNGGGGGAGTQGICIVVAFLN